MTLLLLALLVRIPEQPEVRPDSDSLNMQATWAWGQGAACAVAGQQGIAYCGVGSSLITVRDFVVRSSLELPGACQDLVLDEHYLYAAAGKAGFVTLSLEDPEDPVLASVLDLPGYSAAVAKLPGLALVALGPSGIAAVDISVPNEPRLESWLAPARNVRSVAGSGTLAFLASDRDGLLVLDRKQGMATIAQVNTGAPASGVAVKESIVYVACADSGIWVVNAARPERPLVIGRLAWPGALGIWVSGSLAIVSYGSLGITLADVSIPAAPRPWCYMPVPDYVYDAVAYDSRLAVAAGAAGLQEFDITSPWSPVMLGSLPVPGYNLDLATADRIAWVCTSSGLRTVDAEHGQMLGACSLPAPPLTIALGTRVGLVGLSDSSISVTGLSPESPRILGRIQMPSPVASVAVQDTIAWVGTVRSGILAVSVANPEQPRPVATIPMPAPVTGLDQSGPVLAAAAADSGVYFWQVKAGVPFRPLASLRLPGRINAISLCEDRAAACGDSGLFVLNLRRLDRPSVELRARLVAEALDVALADTLCWVAADWAGILCFQVSRRLCEASPHQLELAGYYGSPTSANSLALSDDSPLVADLYCGPRRLQIGSPVPPVAGPPLSRSRKAVAPAVAFPPTIAVGVLADSGPASVALLDAAGHRLLQARLASSPSWQRVEYPAFPLGAGVYFVRVKSGPTTEVLKTQLIR